MGTAKPQNVILCCTGVVGPCTYSTKPATVKLCWRDMIHDEHGGEQARGAHKKCSEQIVALCVHRFKCRVDVSTKFELRGVDNS